MTIDEFLAKVIRKLKRIVGNYLFHYPRIFKYTLLSTCQTVIGKPIVYQPTQLLGGGTIMFGNNVKLGVNPSPGLYSGYGYIDARKAHATIRIVDDVWINNNVMIISEGEGIEIGAKTLIGFNVEITDSNFHDLHPDKRMGGVAKTAKVTIGKNVFIGSNVKILKGVSIGDNSVIANGTVQNSVSIG